MERTSFAAMECPIARAVDEIGEGWSLLLLREAFKGASTFGDFEGALPITPTTLTRRLDLLTERGFFARQRYERHPPRDRYVLTDKALDLLPVLLALGAWGNRWLTPEGRLLDLVDAEDGRPLEVAIVDRTTQKPLRSGEVALRPGPGASKRLRAALSTPRVLGPRRGSRTTPRKRA